MTLYREYRGFDGCKFRVAEHSIAQPRPAHAHAPFPFARLAAGLGKDRDKFAELVRHRPLIDDALRMRDVTRMVAGLETSLSEPLGTR